MAHKKKPPSVRILPEDVANKIAAGEVVERPASVVKELVENALDAGATRISVRVVGAGRRVIEVIDNGHGMGSQDALLSIERHATSKIRKADDLDNITTLGFRGEAIASIAAVSRFELVTRRASDESATRIQIDGGVLRDVSQVAGPVGTRVVVNRLYFNTPVRAKFLKGITTELSHCIDTVQRHALTNVGVGFQFTHNDKIILDVPEHASTRERVALIWGLGFARDMFEISGEHAGLKVKGLIGSPALSRSTRSHQFFFLNGRPVVNRSAQFGFEDGYQGLLTIGRHPVGVLLLSVHPRFVDVNVHPAKREIRFRDERAARDALRNVVRAALETVSTAEEEAPVAVSQAIPRPSLEVPSSTPEAGKILAFPKTARKAAAPVEPAARYVERDSAASEPEPEAQVQGEFEISSTGDVKPAPVYRAVQEIEDVALQLFDTYLLVPEDDRLLIIDQHALHERLNYDALRAELDDHDYDSQQLAVPILIEVAPAQVKLIESKLALFSSLGIELEAFGDDTFQVTAVCHLYDEANIADAVYRVLDELGQGNLFDSTEFVADLLRLTMRACRASVKAGDRLSSEEKRHLIDGFRRIRPPYTCPHGRPIITELTIMQMEKSFRRRQ